MELLDHTFESNIILTVIKEVEDEANSCKIVSLPPQVETTINWEEVAMEIPSHAFVGSLENSIIFEILIGVD